MNGHVIAAIVALILFVFLAVAPLVLLCYYLTTGNDKPFLWYYSKLLGVKRE